MISPVIFYTLILAIVDVLQYFLVPLVLNHGTGEPGGATNFLNLYIYKNFFTYQNMSYGATLAWLLFGITLADHARPVLARRGAGSTTRASASDGRALSLAPISDRPRPSGATAGRAARSSLTFIAVVVVAAFLSPLLRSFTSRSRTPTRSPSSNSPLYPAEPGDVRLPGPDVRRLPGADRRHGPATWRSSRRAATSSSSSIPANPGAGADHLAGLVADADAGLAASIRTGRTTPTSGTRSSTRGCSSTRSRSR